MCQCRHKTPAILPVLPIRAAVNLGGDAVGFYIFPFHTALSALLRSWNPFRFLRRRIDRVPLLSILPAMLSSNPVPAPATRLRHRRADYHRHKIEADPVYAQVVLDSRKQWRAEHADYQKIYWRTHPEAAERKPSAR